MTTLLSWFRLRPIVALVLAIFFIAAGIVFALVQDAMYRAEHLDKTKVQAQILASSTAAALIFDDKAAAQEYVDALKADPYLEAAAVFLPDGRVLGSFARSGAAPIPAKPPRAGVIQDSNVVVVLPVIQDKSKVGTVYLRAREEPMSRRLPRYGAILLLALMAGLVILVLGGAQHELGRANEELERRAVALSDANRSLQQEMEVRARAEEALRQSQKMEAVGQLSGGIAHDFNNLLSISLGNLQLLKRRLTQGRIDVAGYADLAIEGIRRAASLTQRLLAFAREQPLAPRPVQLSALIANILELVRNAVGPNVVLETRLDSKWWTLCDPGQMENVIINIAINARDAMPAGGRLSIQTEDVRVAVAASDSDTAEFVEIRVTDDGTGMNEIVRARAMDPFFTTKDVGKGTGLGLSTAFGYIRQSKGDMRIESEVGRGTTIVILMPREQALQVSDASGEGRNAA